MEIYLRSKFFCIALILVSEPSTLNAQNNQAIYVRDSGDDRNDGQSLDTGFRTLERARQAARQMSSPKTIMISGTFALNATFDLGPQDAGTHWQAVPGSSANIQAGTNVGTGFYIHDADGTSISGLNFAGFKHNSIFAINSKHLMISSNTIRETLSDGWSQGAIHLTGSVSNSTIKNNIIDGADYGGIVIDTFYSSDVSNIIIKNNTVKHTCRKIKDCGAIYINDRGRQSDGSIISGNNIEDFGPFSAEGRAIYLDDWATGIIVENNVVAGPGRFSIQIHGGSNNKIRHNRFDIRKIYDGIVYQAITDDSNFMNNNYLSDNIFILDKGEYSRTIFSAYRPTKAHWINLINNKKCVVYKKFSSLSFSNSSHFTCSVLNY